MIHGYSTPLLSVALLTVPPGGFYFLLYGEIPVQHRHGARCCFKIARGWHPSPADSLYSGCKFQPPGLHSRRSAFSLSAFCAGIYINRTPSSVVSCREL